jgi:hypothetical protein
MKQDLHTIEGSEMDAIIGKYRAHMEKTGLFLNHPTGIRFDLTLTEALGLMEFIKVYQAAIADVQHGAEAGSEGVVAEKEAD